MGFEGGLLSLLTKLISITRRPPQEGSVRVAGVHSEVDIHVDELGVPHIYAHSESDLLFGQGWICARDRLWQIHVVCLLSRGELSRIAGEKAIFVDKLARTFNFKYLGECDALELSSEDKLHIQSYVDGLNSYVQSPLFKRPVEFTLTGERDPEFTIEDVTAMFRLMQFQMSHGFYECLARHMVSLEMPQELLDELHYQRPDTIPTVCPSGSPEWNALLQESIPVGQGSNCWAVGGEFTKSGKPLLASDPHLTLTLPGIAYMTHLICEEDGINAVGPGFPGIPGLIMGHTDRFAWGATLSYCDVGDVLQERLHLSEDGSWTYEFEGEQKPVRLFHHDIQVKGQRDPLKFVSMRTHNGPVFREAMSPLVQQPVDLSVRTTYLLSPEELRNMPAAPRLEGDDRDMDPFEAILMTSPMVCVRMLKCQTIERVSQYREELSNFNLSFAVAFESGDYGSLVCGAVPIRRVPNSRTVLDATLQEHCWVGFIPVRRLPIAVNPSQGFVVLANHDVLDDPDYPYDLGNIFINGMRATRIQELLMDSIQQGHLFDVEAFRLMQLDVVTPFARILQDTACDVHIPEDEDEAVKEAFARFFCWDGTLDVDSVGGTIYQVFRHFLASHTLGPFLSPNVLKMFMGVPGIPKVKSKVGLLDSWSMVVQRMMDNPESLLMKEVGGKDKVLLQSMRDSVDWLTARLGTNQLHWGWGKIHQVIYPHALGQRIPIFNRGPFAISGDADTIMNTCFSSFECETGPPFFAGLSLPSYRMVADTADLDHARFILPAGNSGHRGTNHYDNFIEPFFRGELLPLHFSQEEILEASPHTLYLHPERE